MKNGHRIYIIAALDHRGGIGKDGKIPWTLKKDLAHFKAVTCQTPIPGKENSVIMGRKTWESLPEKYRPLPQRKNIVITHQPEYKAKGALVSYDITHALEQAIQYQNGGDVFFIGGATIYEQAIQLQELDGLFLTFISHDFHCDTFFPSIPDRFNARKEIASLEEAGVALNFILLEKPHVSPLSVGFLQDRFNSPYAG